MAVFGVTVKDIEHMLRTYKLQGTPELKQSIVDLIEVWDARWVMDLRAEGIVPTSIPTAHELFRVSAHYVRLRVSAETAQQYTHQDPDLSKTRMKMADTMSDDLHEKPEAFLGDLFDVNRHRGSFRTDRILEERAPGTLGTGRGRPRWGWSGF